jgi:hypothetical protein
MILGKFRSVEACEYIKTMVLKEIEIDNDTHIKVGKEIFMNNETVIDDF